MVCTSSQESWFKAIYAACHGASPAIVVVGTHLDGAKIDNYHNVIFNKYATLYPTIRFATAIRYFNPYPPLPASLLHVTTRGI
jgi:hypothetical protein